MNDSLFEFTVAFIYIFCLIYAAMSFLVWKITWEWDAIRLVATVAAFAAWRFVERE